MLELTIKVSGPGSCISGIVNDLKATLIDKGHFVKLIDDHPSDKLPSKDEIWFIRLEADHLPWGG